MVREDDGSVARHYRRMPAVGSGQKVGLFGGSFNPPHLGHLHVTEQALRRLELDWIWWLVTPGNPLKDHSQLAPLADRIAACEALAAHPRIVVTAFEIDLPTSFTADTLALTRTRNPDARFVWVMGADNLAQFHRWERWEQIAQTMPIAVVDRPGSTLALHTAQAARVLSRYRVDEADAAGLAFQRPPAWTFLHGPRNHLSSTALRAKAAKASL